MSLKLKRRSCSKKEMESLNPPSVCNLGMLGSEVEMDEQHYENKENGSKRRYSRYEMESLRYLNVEEQQRFWNEILPSLASEYEGIAISKTRKQSSKNNVDHPQQCLKKRKNNAPVSCLPKKQGEACSRYMEHKWEDTIVGDDSSQHATNIREENLVHFPFARCASDEVADSETIGNEYDEGIGSDSDDDYDSIQKPAFLVEGDPDFDAGPPQDGIEYLRRVRWELARIPRVKVANLNKSTTMSEQTVYMPSIPDIAKCQEHLLPSKHWEDAFLADFSELRLSLMQLDSVSSGDSSLLKKHINITEDDSSSSTGGPKLSKILGMDVVSRASMLKNHIKLIEAKDSLSKTDCAWLYALCAVVDTPLDADMGAAVRCLLRKCAKLRSVKSNFDDEVAMLNILITVSGKFFGQSET